MCECKSCIIFLSVNNDEVCFLFILKANLNCARFEKCEVFEKSDITLTLVPYADTHAFGIVYV